MRLIIENHYKLKIYGLCERVVDVQYAGKLQEKTPIQNETHGFRGANGIYAVTKDDLKTRVTQQ